LESNLGDTHSVSLGEKFLISSQLAPLDSPVFDKDEAVWYFNLPIAETGGIDCFVYEGGVSPINVLNGTFDHLHSFHEEENLYIEDEFFVSHGTRLQGDNVVYELDKFFTTLDKADELYLNMAQGRVSNLMDNVLACVHFSFGYRETFDEVFNTMVESWIGAGDEILVAQQHQIIKTKIAGKTVGFMEQAYIKNDLGEHGVMNFGGAFIADGRDLVVMTDAFEVNGSSADGLFRGGYSQMVTNGEFISELTTEKNDDGHWQITGTDMGKDISLTVEVEEEIKSTIGAQKELQELLADTSRDEVKYHAHISDIDATKAVNVTVKILSREKNNNRISLKMGPMLGTMIVDDSGNLKRANMPVDGVQMQLESVHISGSFE